MVRKFGFLVGLGFVGVLLISLTLDLVNYFKAPPEKPAEYAFFKHPEPVSLPSNGVFGKFDNQQLQRGFQVYKEVCAACHGLHQVAFRDLEQIGYNEAEVKAIASQWAIETPSLNPDTGEAVTRKPVAADKFPDPYANETAARAANGGALPPDLSLITKARENGPAYLHSLLMGYQPQPAKLLKDYPQLKTPEGKYYNPYFHSLNISMPPPLTSDGQVTYSDGTKATRDQMSTDVTAFLVWAAEPKLAARHATGFWVLLYLGIGTLLGYMAYRNVWATEKRKVAPKGALDPEHMAKREAAKAESHPDLKG